MKKLILRTLIGALFGAVVGGAFVTIVVFIFGVVMDSFYPYLSDLPDRVQALILLSVLSLGAMGSLFGAITGAGVAFRNVSHHNPRTGVVLGALIALFLVVAYLFWVYYSFPFLQIQSNDGLLLPIALFTFTGALVGGLTPYITGRKVFQQQ